ncbi:MAG: hypothetical protein EBX35_01330 [Planctomycetia bacterium]|nr:hypothetical protein [Planctomycetia bacterium]
MPRPPGGRSRPGRRRSTGPAPGTAARPRPGRRRRSRRTGRPPGPGRRPAPCPASAGSGNPRS